MARQRSNNGAVGVCNGDVTFQLRDMVKN